MNGWLSPIYLIHLIRPKSIDFEKRKNKIGMRTARLLTVSQHALCRGGLARGVSGQGVSAHGVSAQGGGFLPRGCLSRGMPAHGGVCVFQHAMGQTPLWTDRHLWKHSLCKLHLRAVTRSNHDKSKSSMVIRDNPCLTLDIYIYITGWTSKFKN